MISRARLRGAAERCGAGRGPQSDKKWRLTTTTNIAGSSGKQQASSGHVCYCLRSGAGPSGILDALLPGAVLRLGELDGELPVPQLARGHHRLDTSEEGRKVEPPLGERLQGPLVDRHALEADLQGRRLRVDLDLALTDVPRRVIPQILVEVHVEGGGVLS